MISLQQKKDALLKEFQTMDINHDNTLSKQEIFAFLDSKVKYKQFFYIMYYDTMDIFSLFIMSIILCEILPIFYVIFL